MLALIYQALGQIDLSRTALEQGRRISSDELRARLDDTGKPPIIEWVDVVVLRELFVREVSTKLDGKPAADNPYVLLVRQRSLERMGRESEAAKISTVARASRSDDSQVALSEARIFAELAIATRNSDTESRAFALLEKAMAARPDDEGLLRARAQLHSARGEWDAATTDLARMFKLTKSASPRWFVAGAWAVGPYPLGRETWKPLWPARCRRNRIQTPRSPSWARTARRHSHGRLSTPPPTVLST